MVEPEDLSGKVPSKVAKPKAEVSATASATGSSSRKRAASKRDESDYTIDVHGNFA